MAGLAVKRGDIVRIAEGKPRPAVIVQADAMPTPEMILVCPLTSVLTESPLYRPKIEPDGNNGLRAPSQLMVDRTGPIRRDRIAGVIGQLAAPDLERLTVALLLILDLTG